MQLSQRQKIWGSRLFGVVVFGCSVVLTPRFWLESSASPAPEGVPVQSIQPFETSSYSCPDCPQKKSVLSRCLTDRTPEHSILWNNSDAPTNSDSYENCDLNVDTPDDVNPSNTF